MKRLMLRASVDPVNLIATLLFFGAILHTFAAGYFMKLSHKLEEQHKRICVTETFAMLMENPLLILKRNYFISLVR